VIAANKPSYAPDRTVRAVSAIAPTVPAGCALSDGCSRDLGPAGSQSCRSCPPLQAAVAWRRDDYDDYCSAGDHLTYDGP
jgi:hypothetical protein